ncbi:CoA transferase subunit A [Desulfosporosinus shakirovi]|uniref:CoA transferase subunit A n=1 Tax=Desulfosporosinus shakirovi TaxID=2885154 RepID=UPI0028A225A4|nr:CoA transferase subunit A [Desulfosporosinus sp. SRJS8]MCB8817851.1 CoA transferase subunit A [Desulfosporosinus sp. SRJS8]
MAKVITSDEVAAMVNKGDTIMVGGFLAVGSPETICDALVRRNVKDLSLICNDTGWPDRGAGKLIMNHQFKKVIASHLGTNRETGRQMSNGELEVELNPQGTLIERIRAGGNGVGGFYTPTGVGTLVAEGKEIRIINGREMLLETPLRAKFAFIKAFLGDKYGNLRYQATGRNFNPEMAFAADIVVAEVDNLVDFMDPEDVTTLGVLVDYLVRRGK